MHAARLLSPKAADERREVVLCSMLLMLVELGQARGTLGDALSAALEAGELLERFHVNSPSLRIWQRTHLAVVQYFLTGTPSRAIHDLTLAFNDATSHGLPRLAALIAAKLCAIYARCGETGTATGLGEAALSAATNVCNPSEVAYVGLELARAYVIRQDATRARTTLERMRSVQGNDRIASTFINLVLAESYLLEGRFRLALPVLEQATASFEGAGITRFYGNALRLRARCLQGIGRGVLAQQRLRESLDVAAGPPLAWV